MGEAKLLPQWEARTALRKLMSAGVGGRLHISRRGVPLIVVRGEPGSSDFVSVCWFRQKRMFRIFTPREDGGQDRVDATTLIDALALVAALEAAP